MCSFRAPEISLNAGEDHKGYIHSDSIGKYNSVDGGLYQPLLSDATQPTSYSVWYMMRINTEISGITLTLSKRFLEIYITNSIANKYY